MGLLLRLTTSDAELLSAIGGKTLIESHGHSAAPGVMQEYVEKNFSTEACLNELQDEKNIFHVLYYRNEPAGYYKIVFDCPHPEVSLSPVSKMERLYLLRSFYDLKLGQQLAQHAIVLSKGNGEKGMWLNVWKENYRAIQFYEKQGFKTIGESEFVLTSAHANPNWVMFLGY